MLVLVELASWKQRARSSSTRGVEVLFRRRLVLKSKSEERSILPPLVFFLFTSRRTQGAVVDAVRDAPRILLQVEGREKSAGKRGARGRQEENSLSCSSCFAFCFLASRK